MVLISILSLGVLNSSGLEQHLQNGSFEDGLSDGFAEYWDGHKGRTEGPAHTGSFYMAMNDGNTISQDFAGIDDNDLEYVIVYYKEGSLILKLKWTSQSSTSNYNCGYSSSWTYCKADSGFIENEELYKIIIEANSDNMKVDDASIWYDDGGGGPI